jgi:hypothetical protein
MQVKVETRLPCEICGCQMTGFFVYSATIRKTFVRLTKGFGVPVVGDCPECHTRPKVTGEILPIRSTIYPEDEVKIMEWRARKGWAT